MRNIPSLSFLLQQIRCKIYRQIIYYENFWLSYYISADLWKILCLTVNNWWTSYNSLRGRNLAYISRWDCSIGQETHLLTLKVLLMLSFNLMFHTQLTNDYIKLEEIQHKVFKHNYTGIKFYGILLALTKCYYFKNI